VSAADLCLALALSALLSVVVAAAQYMRAEKAEAEVARLTAERDALAQIKRHIDEVRNGTGWTVQIYGVLLQQCDQYGKTIDTRRAERAEAERDALAAQVARVEEVLDHWRTVDEGNAAYAERIGERSRFADGLASRADMLRAALAGPEADTSDTQPTDQEDQS
jgi:small-conductance mechanosensitive channel